MCEGEAVFVNSAQSLDGSREKACWYGERASGGLLGGINTYAYVNGNPVSMIDPYGLFGINDIYGGIYSATGGWSPSQTTVNAVAGFGDGASLGISSLIRDAADIDGVDKCSDAYKNGGWASFALGSGRLAYAGLAKVGAAAASSGAAASAFRSGLRTAFGGGKSFRPPNLAKYGTDAELQAAAGRTNSLANAWGGGAAAAGAAAGSGCGCSQ